jgi:DNA replication protein DnaC
VGYLTYGTDAANMLFHVVSERRRRRSMILTTNKALKAWRPLLHDDDLGQAIIDRVRERRPTFGSSGTRPSVSLDRGNLPV